jgi:hypothetical protein
MDMVSTPRKRRRRSRADAMNIIPTVARRRSV